MDVVFGPNMEVKIAEILKKKFFFLEDFSIFFEINKKRVKRKGLPYILDNIGIIQVKNPNSGAYIRNFT